MCFRINRQVNNAEMNTTTNNEMIGLDSRFQLTVAMRLSISSRSLQQLLRMVGCPKLPQMLMIAALEVALLIASIAPASFSPERIPAETVTATTVERSAMTH